MQQSKTIPQMNRFPFDQTKKKIWIVSVLNRTENKNVQ